MYILFSNGGKYVIMTSLYSVVTDLHVQLQFVQKETTNKNSA